MPNETEHMTVKCSKKGCGQVVEILKAWTAGGMNDYGGFVLKCDRCGTVFSTHVGRDVNDSRVERGATLLDRYDDEAGNKGAVLAKHGLAAEQ